MTFVTNFTVSILSASLAERMIGSPWPLAALAAFLTGFVVMMLLLRVNP